MKCPKCGIYYDDSDRECPMCGAPKPLFAKDKSNLAKTTAYPASSDNKNTDSMGSILDLGSKKKTSWSKPKKDGRNTIIAVVIIILISVLPALINNVTSIISNVNQNIVQVEPVSDDDTSVEVTKLYNLDNEVDFNIFSDGTYYVIGNDFDEWGYITIYEYDTDEILEFETFLLNNGIDFDKFNITTAVLTPDNSQQDKYILIAESKNDERAVFYDLNSEIPWLEDGNFIEATLWV